MSDKKLKDPADAKAEEKEKREAEEEMESLDVARLGVEDFKAIPPQVARAKNPFDGYPIKPKVKIGEYADPDTKKTKDLMVSATHIVGLAPSFLVAQDISSRRETHHSRMIEDRDIGKQNVDVVFDRKLELKGGGTMRVAIVKSNSVRAQVCFSLNEKSGKPQVDQTYLLLDSDQKHRLRDLFQLIHNPAADKERLSAAISDESDEPVETVPDSGKVE